MYDGRIFFAGGHCKVGDEGNDCGEKRTYIFDPNDNSFTEQSPMAEGRWYPTVLAMPDRQMLVMSGTFKIGEELVMLNKRPSLWIPQIPNEQKSDLLSTLPEQVLNSYYPHVFIDPLDGKPYFSPKSYDDLDQDNRDTLKYNPVSSRWTIQDAPQYGLGLPLIERTYPSSIMVDGFILKTGGGVSQDNANVIPSVKTTVSIDLNGDREWKQRTDMHAERMNHTLVGLPDGKVLAIGGSLKHQYDHEDDKISDRVRPEMFDTAKPEQGWVPLALPGTPEGLIPRGYHSTALLNPNGDVLIAGGEPDSNGDIPSHMMQQFSPPYGGDEDWKERRPSITSAPTEIYYGQPFQITAEAEGTRQIAKVTLISLGSTTHAYNENQTIMMLPFQQLEDRKFRVSWQTKHRFIPPGYYMLFALDSKGVPSVASIVKVADVDRTLFSGGSLSSGLFYQAPSYPQDLAMGDERFLGNGILSTGLFDGKTAVTLTGRADSAINSTFEVYAEMLTDAPTTYEVQAFNYQTEKFVTLGSGRTQVGVQVGTISTATPLLPPFAQPYISYGREVRVKITWTGPTGGYTVFLDRVEARSRPRKSSPLETAPGFRVK